MTARHQLPEAAEFSSSSRPSSSSSSGYWPSASPSSASYACHSASSSQSSFDAWAPHATRCRAPRPLPQIPNSPSVSSPSPCGGAFTLPRPLPVPPACTRTPPQTPPLIREPGPSNQHMMRPLPLPRSPDKCNPPQRLPSPPALRVSLPVPGASPHSPYEPSSSLSPFSPMSPIVFRSAASLNIVSPEDESGPRRFSTAAFEEEQPASAGDMTPPRSSQESSASTSTLKADADTERAPDTDSSTVSTIRLSDCENVQMTVEVVPLSARTAKRTSRFWMVEKKGKRRVADDYNEILQELRML
ncbi:hypothetical protein EIP86_010267 [Pleurotus ostreatoroseus]|nr:hypothetical protein EIP86_010267 [Pleurotus ostreatoroseus]